MAIATNTMSTFCIASADRLEARYTSARAQTKRLTSVLLAKAFRGELVPQDPSDEPASILLERIRPTRASSLGSEKHGRFATKAGKLSAKISP